LNESSERGSSSIVKDGNPYLNENLESNRESFGNLRAKQKSNLADRIASDISTKEAELLIKSRSLPVNSGRADRNGVDGRIHEPMPHLQYSGRGRGANNIAYLPHHPRGRGFPPPVARQANIGERPMHNGGLPLRAPNLDVYDYSHFMTVTAETPSELEEDTDDVPDDADHAATASDSGSDYDRSPRTAFLKASIRLIYRGNRNLDGRYNALYATANDHPTEMLVDTGCGMSVISRAFYNRLKWGIIGPTHADTDVSIQNCHNTAQPCVGTTQVRIWFRSTNFYDATVLISDHLAHDFILGLDFLGSRHVRMLTPKHLVLNRKESGLHMKETLIVKVMRPLVATNNHCAIIEPFSSALLNIKVTGTDVTDKQSSFTIGGKSFIRGLKVLPTVYNGNLKNDSFLLPVYNDGMSEVFIDENCEIASISPAGHENLSPQIINVNRMMICETKEPFNVPINNVLLNGPENIMQDKVFILTRNVFR